MQPGPKRQLPSEKKAKGTYQQVRDRNRIEIIEPMSMPQRPDWLTSEAGEVWLDDVGRVRLATESDECETTRPPPMFGPEAPKRKVGSFIAKASLSTCHEHIHLHKQLNGSASAGKEVLTGTKVREIVMAAALPVGKDAQRLIRSAFLTPSWAATAPTRREARALCGTTSCPAAKPDPLRAPLVGVLPAQQCRLSAAK